jgi:hypothetical protein
MNDVMLDLETLSSEGDAAIVSIGCFEFDLTKVLSYNPAIQMGDYPKERFFQRNIRIDSALKYGTVSGSTLEWWFKLPERARLAVLDEPVTLERALQDLSIWWPKDAQMWSHATFDAPIIQRAYRVARDSRPPWHYRDTKDLRTLSRLAGPPGEEEDYPDIGELDHVAYADAWQQAVAATRMYARINEGFPEVPG